MPNRQVEILKEAKRRGWHNPTAGQVRRCAAAVMSKKEKREAAREIAQCAGRKLLGRVVPLEVKQQNEQICRSNACNSFRETSDDKPACLRCGCSSKLLSLKWGDPEMHCPAVDPETKKPYWDNREVSTCPIQ